MASRALRTPSVLTGALENSGQRRRPSISLSFVAFFLSLTLACGGGEQKVAGPDEPDKPSIPEKIAPFEPSALEDVGGISVINNQLTIVTKSSMSVAKLRDLVTEFDGKIISSFPGLDGSGRAVYQVRFGTSSVQDVAQIANQLTRATKIITVLERVLPISGTHFDNDALSIDKRWAYDTIGVSDSWHLINRHGSNRENVRIGVIDSGVDSDHEEFVEKIALGQSFLPDEPFEWDDVDGHGTKVTGIIDSRATNGGMNGVLGPAQARGELYIYRVGLVEGGTSCLAQHGLGILDSDAIIGALMKAQADELHVVNMSFGPFYPAVLDGARERAKQFLEDLLAQNENLILVTSAGNFGEPADMGWPIADTHNRFLLVGGTDKADTRWETGETICGRPIESAVGPISIGAPATQAWTTALEGSYSFFSGTSAAAPQVAGAVGTLLKIGVRPENVKRLLDSGGAEISGVAWNRLDLCRSVARALGLTDPSHHIIAESGQDANRPPSNLYRVEPFECGVDRKIATITTPSGATPVITDLALDSDSTLWGASFDTLYRIDRTTAIAEPIGSFGVEEVNALDFSPDGVLYGATAPFGLFGSLEPGKFVRININSGQATVIGKLDPNLQSAGDLEFAQDGSLFATVRDLSGGENSLARIDSTTGNATLVDPGTPIGFPFVFGLHFVDGFLFGLSSAENGTGKLLVIDTMSGIGSMIRSLQFDAFGAAMPVERHEIGK